MRAVARWAVIAPGRSSAVQAGGSRRARAAAKAHCCVPFSPRSEISQLRNYKFVKGNLLSADLIKYVLETEEIDTIIHAAAQVRLALRRSPPLTRRPAPLEPHATPPLGRLE